ncbi:hypothetical protein [Mucilaginibacter pedocola]|uniref:Uncharacterized protein n=1 Tax=Mucilaginibacter pedocola TaxID=1792845 RepID=A0A1S9P980_9SPHI|nr:hypothetical protein [Mucilaginibacter pedocola]OOQ57387.1 hypothetical protein BC343_14900 [Mucilaginibacter pedocola]
MEEEKEPSAEYLRDFNDGYLMAENHPEVADLLSNIKSESTRISAMKSGIATSTEQKLPSRYPSWIKSPGPSRTDKSEPTSPNKNQERDR